MPITDTPLTRSRWYMPAFCVALGLLILGASWIGGTRDEGLFGLGVMTALALGVFFGQRSDTVAGLSGPGRDERWASIDLRANAITGLVMIVVLIGAWLYELTQGRTGEPYTQLCALAGVTYLLAIAHLRHRG